MAFSPYAVKQILDWTLGGATPSPVDQRWLGLVDADGNEIDPQIGYSRRSVAFNEAGSPIAGASMLSGMTFGAYSPASPMSVFGFRVFDAASSGNELMGSSFATPLTFKKGGGVVVAALSISLA